MIPLQRKGLLIVSLYMLIVHNWTIDQVVTWLTYEVELPQYSETFKMNAVDGSTLPRLVEAITSSLKPQPHEGELTG